MTRVSVLAEGRGDALFLGELAKLLLARPIEVEVTMSEWPRLKNLIKPTLRKAHYCGSTFVIVGVDVDDSAWDAESSAFRRQIELEDEVKSALADLPLSCSLAAVVATAVPCREAWLDFLNGGSSSEGSWLQRGANRPGSQLRRELKEKVYRSDRPDWLTEEAVVRRAVAALPARLSDFRSHFPSGLHNIFVKLQGAG